MDAHTNTGLLHGNDGKAAEIRRTVVHGIAQRGNGQAIGTYHRASGCVQGASRPRSRIWFKPVQLIRVQNLQAENAIFLSLPVQSFNGVPVPLVKSQNQGSVLPVIHTQFGGGAGHKRRAPDAQPRLQTARSGIKARVHNPAVRTGGAGRRVICPLQNTDRNLIPAKNPGSHTPCDASPDHCHIIHISHLLFAAD